MNGRQSPQRQGQGNGSAPTATDDVERRAATASDAPESLMRQFRELTEYVLHYVSAKSDGVRLSVRSAALLVGLTALGFVALSGIIVAASWSMISGGAEGLAVLLGGRIWAGNMVAGFLVLSGLGLGMSVFTAKRKRTSRERTAKKYEDRQVRQQAEFGHSVGEPAAGGVRENE